MTIPTPGDDGTFYPSDSTPEDLAVDSAPDGVVSDRWGTPAPPAPVRDEPVGPWNAPPAATPDFSADMPSTGTSHNSRSTIAMVLSVVAVAGVGAWFLGVSVPLLLIVGLGIAGFAMGIAGYLSGRRGLASNGGLGAGAAALGAVAVLGVVAIYAIVLAAIGQILGG